MKFQVVITLCGLTLGAPITMTQEFSSDCISMERSNWMQRKLRVTQPTDYSSISLADACGRKARLKVDNNECGDKSLHTVLYVNKSLAVMDVVNKCSVWVRYHMCIVPRYIGVIGSYHVIV
jgi:hypothetical protein